MKCGGINVYYDGKKNIVIRGNKEYPYKIGEMALEVQRSLPNDRWLTEHLYQFPDFEEPLTKDGAIRATQWMIDMPSRGMPPATAAIFQGMLINLHQAASSVIWKSSELREKYLEAVNENIRSSCQQALLGDYVYLDSLGGYLKSCFSSYLVDATDFRAAFEGLIAKDNEDASEEEIEDVKRFMRIFQERYSEQELECAIMYDENLDRFMTVHTIGDLRTLMAFEYCHMKETGSLIRICENCGRFFIPESRSDEKYCIDTLWEDRQRTCKDVGAERKWMRKVDENPALKKYRNKYASLSMAIKRSKEKGDSWVTDLQKERKELSKKKAKMQCGEITEQEFIDWIDKTKYGRKKE